MKFKISAKTSHAQQTDRGQIEGQCNANIYMFHEVKQALKQECHAVDCTYHLIP